MVTRKIFASAWMSNMRVCYGMTNHFWARIWGCVWYIYVSPPPPTRADFLSPREKEGVCFITIRTKPRRIWRDEPASLCPRPRLGAIWCAFRLAFYEITPPVRMPHSQAHTRPGKEDPFPYFVLHPCSPATPLPPPSPQHSAGPYQS